ncbi:MAG: hypothetical protein IK081_04960, partial [Lachnospiraceae bacterium]|nr:hypothetical protein [Lachnospiraceae bacterium]
FVNLAFTVLFRYLFSEISEIRLPKSLFSGIFQGCIVVYLSRYKQGSRLATEKEGFEPSRRY